MPKFFRSLFRLRTLPALLLSLPALLMVTIHLWRGYSRLDTYRRLSGDHSKITADALQLAVHDTLKLDLRRMFMDPPPENSPLPVFKLEARRPAWEALQRSANVEESREYVSAKLTHDNTQFNVQLRLRGSRFWNTSLPQKSLKVKLDKGRLIDGHRVFNLLNDPTPMVVGEHLILELARDLGVLTPTSDFARVTVNNKDLGVFHYEAQPDESLLRRSRRVPGSVFSGDLPSSAKTAELWTDAKRWNKVASKNDSVEEEANFAELERLLGQLSGATFAEFRQIALTEFDLEAFARVDLLDVAFGGDQHDFRQNHKLYFDPYRGRWEPIAWNFRGFKSDPKLNLVENPLLIRLKQVPEYLELRNRLLHEFLAGTGTPAALREQGIRVLKRLAPDLQTDPYWDAYRLLPGVDRFHRRMVRPLNLKKAVMVFDSEFTTYRHRHAQLLATLEQNPLYLTQGATNAASSGSNHSPAPGAPISDSTKVSDSTEAAVGGPAPVIDAFETALTVTVDGFSGVELSAAEASFGSDCLNPGWQLFARGVALSSVVHGLRAEFVSPLKVYPNIGLRKRENANARRSMVRTQMLATNYPLTLKSNCTPEQVQVSGRQLTTGMHVSSRSPSAALRQRATSDWPNPSQVPTLTAGQLSPHPWKFETPLPSELVLGPGEVNIPATRVYPRNQAVRVAPGTHLWMSKNASLIFLGPVHFEGTASEPIEVSGRDGALWGGIAVQGAATENSSLLHLTVRGGTTPSNLTTIYPAMVNIHDTRGIVLQHARLGNNGSTGDVLHAAYVDDLTIEDTEVVNTTGDAIDLEFCSASLSRVSLIKVGDDGLDLMGSTVRLSDSLVLGAKGNGISAGEQTELGVRNTLLAENKYGVLAKNASEVDLSGSLLFRNKVGVHVYTRSVRYAGDSRVRASVLFVIDSAKRSVQRKDKKRDTLDQGRIFEYLPRPGGLDSLRNNLPGLTSWSDLPKWLESKRREAVL